MSASKSHVSFNGEAESEEIVVVDPMEAYITGVVVENYTVTSQDANCRAAGDLYFTMSEGGNQLAQSFSNVVLNNGNRYTNSVEVNGYIYTITVTKTSWVVNN